MDYKVTFKLIYKHKTVSGKVVNIRNNIDETHAKNRFYPYIAKKYKNAKKAEIQQIELIQDSEVERLRNIMGMN